MTSGTYGRTSTTSSSSDALMSSLASRLRAKTASLGSTLFALTWKERVMPSGLRIYALRASGRRISDSGFTGWPTPNAHFVDAKPRPPVICNRKATDPQIGLADVAVHLCSWPTPTSRDWKDGAECQNVPINALLGRTAWLAGWPTPTVGNSMGSQSSEGMSVTGRTPDGRKNAVSLNHVASFAGWPTPTSSLADKGVRTLEGGIREAMRGHGPDLAALACLASGPIPNGSPVETAKRGQLNPALSRWLMGLPPEWDVCAVTAMQSLPRSRKRSSKPT